MPAKKDEFKLTRCVAHRMFNQEMVAFIQFHPRPPRQVIDMMRKHGHYRKEPWAGAGPGWYVSKCNLGSLHEDSEKLCPALAKQLVSVAEKIVNDPASIACPSREAQVSQSSGRSASKKRGNYIVNKVGHS